MNEAFILASIGGVFIGGSAAVMLLFIGRIAGISGIVRQALFCEHGTFSALNSWRWLFLVGILCGAFIAHKFIGIPIPVYESANHIVIVVSGFLVGVGISIGSGCTSGHGICGLSRISLRSLVATMCFMGAGIVTVFIMRHLL